MVRAAGKAQKQVDAQKHKCLVPGCKSEAIGSHSQQRRGQLKVIARDGCVYAVEKNFYKAIKRPRRRFASKYKVFPTSVASVFAGYCSKHDAQLFAPVEKAPLERDDPLQACLLFLRSNSYEYLQKRRVRQWISMFLSETQDQLSIASRNSFVARLGGMDVYLSHDAPFYFRKIFTALERQSFIEFESAWVVVPARLPVSTSCCMSPLMHSHIQYMESRPGIIQPNVSFSIVPTRDETHIVVTWLREHSSLASWFREALADPVELEMMLNQLAFGETEDTCISPDFWETLSMQDQELLAQAAGYTRYAERPAPVPRVIRL